MTAECPHPAHDLEDDHCHQLQIPNKSGNVSGKRTRLGTSRLQTSNIVSNSSPSRSHDALDDNLSPRTAVSTRLQFLNLDLPNPNPLQVANTMSPSPRKQQAWTIHPDSKTEAEHERQTFQAHRWSPSPVSHISETPQPSSQEGSEEIPETQLTQDYDEGDTLIAARPNGSYESQCEIFEFRAGSQLTSRRRSWSNPQTPTTSFHSDISPAIADDDGSHPNKRVRPNSPSADHDDYEMLIEIPSTPPDGLGYLQHRSDAYELPSTIPETPSPARELPHHPVALVASRHSPSARKFPSRRRYLPPPAPTPPDTKIADDGDRMDTGASATVSSSRSRSPPGRKLSSLSREKCSTPPVSAPCQQTTTEIGSTLWWREDELTGYNPDDPDDDGAGVNGVGYQKSAAEAWRIGQARKKQIEEWRVREQRDARAARRHARTGDGRKGGVGKKEDGRTDDGRKVGEHRVMLGRVSKASSGAGSPVERRSPARTLKGEKPERSVRFQVG